jgi:hypothetical protein
MDLCHASYALGNISAARSSLSSAQRALARMKEPTEADARALLAVKTALDLLESAIHELGSEIVAQHLSSRIAA